MCILIMYIKILRREEGFGFIANTSGPTTVSLNSQIVKGVGSFTA